MIIDFKQLQEDIDKIKIKEKRKTFLQILDKSYDEVLISKLVAYFLNERNINRCVIKEILNRTAQDNEIDFVELLNGAKFESIKTEDAISTQSRLDIIIKYDTFWIVIENKINAWESREGQTNDYEKHINSINKDKVPVKYIYLKPNYNKSNPSNKHFSILHYVDLMEIFKNISYLDLNDKKNEMYLQDFIIHMEEYLMKDNQFNIEEEDFQFYIKNREKIDYLVENYKNSCAYVRNNLVERLTLRFPDYLVHDSSSYIQIFKPSWDNRGKTGIHFEIAHSKANINFDNLLGDKAVTLRFAIHNEKNTKDRYTDIIQRTLFKQDFMFNTPENIESSIERIVSEMESIIATHAKIIDEKIAKIDG